jgi:hypothetical protein
MSEAIICPVCETTNDPTAINCEVCGERLAPAAPGEVIPAEQNMAATLAAQAAGEQPASGQFAMDDDDFKPEPALDEVYAEGHMEPASTPVESEDAAMHIEQPNDLALPGTDLAPGVLYSHMSGEAYHAGSPEYEEGFGPMGDQLLPTPPATSEVDTYEAPSAPVQEAQDYEIQPMDEPISFGDTGAFEPSAEEPTPEPVVEKQSPFQVSGPNPAVALPKPGTYEQPAELTLYFQKQPVLSYSIDTDEVLIGRKDIRADIDPDIDLTTWDHDAYVSRKHAYIYRQNKNYTLYAVSNSGLQLNNDLMDLGDRRQLSDGDIIVIAGILAMKFTLPA